MESLYRRLSPVISEPATRDQRRTTEGFLSFRPSKGEKPIAFLLLTFIDVDDLVAFRAIPRQQQAWPCATAAGPALSGRLVEALGEIKNGGKHPAMNQVME
jgi:hypothetical protein